MDKKRSVIISVIVILLILVGVFTVTKLKTTEKKKTYLDVAKKTFEFVKSMETSTGIKNYIDCNKDKYSVISKNQFFPAVYQLLAYSSLYDATQDEIYVDQIRKIEQMIYYHFGYIYRDLVDEYYEFNYGDSSVFGKDYTPNSSKGMEPEFMVVSLGALQYQLRLSYDLLKNKNVLENEKLFEELLSKNAIDFRDIEKNYFDAEAAGLFLLALRSAAENKVSLNNDEFLSEAELMMEGVNELKTNNDFCTEKYANYNLNLLKNGYDDSIAQSLLKLTINEMGDNIWKIQTCMEILYQSYRHNNNKLYIEKLVEINKALMDISMYNEDCEDIFYSYTYISTDHPIRTYFIDNANQIYFITRPEVRNEAIP